MLLAATAGMLTNCSESPTISKDSVPAGPSPYPVTQITSSSCLLSWEDRSSNELGFRIYQTTDNRNYIIADSVEANVTNKRLTGLSPDTEYWFNIRSYNSAGEAGQSYQYVRTLASNALLNAPTNLTTSATGETTIDLSWQDNSDNENVFRIDASWYGTDRFWTIDSTTANVSSKSITNLSPNTLYYFRVSASNAEGQSEYSNTSSAMTLSGESVPAAPSNLTAVVSGQTSAQLTWQDNSSNESVFLILCSEFKHCGWTPVAQAAPDAESALITGLDNNAKYFLRVVAIGEAGPSPSSNTVSLYMPSDPAIPVAPTLQSAEATGPSSIRLSWNDNSNNEEYFVLEKSLTLECGYTLAAQVTADVSLMEVVGLAANTTYFFRMYALNASGKSFYSGFISETTLADAAIPNAPSNLQASATGASTIRLTWDDNSNNESGFHIEISLSPSTGFIQTAINPAGTTELLIDNLAENTTYYFRVRAFNSEGTSEYSRLASATTYLGQSLPASPSNLWASADGSSSIQLSWRDNSQDEQGFKIEQSLSPSGGFTTVTTVGANVTTTIVSGLSAGTTYHFRVHAYNSTGNSGYSNTAGATTTQNQISKTRFVNNASYAVVSLKIDDQEQFSTAPDGIVPGGYYEMELAPGTHQYYVEIGYWRQSLRVMLYNAWGEFTQNPGVTDVATIDDFSIQQIMSNFSDGGVWQGIHYDYENTGLWLVYSFTFYSDGSYEFSTTNPYQEWYNGTYSQISRDPANRTVTFSVGSFFGVLNEESGTFIMNNGPNNKTITYSYQGSIQ